MRHDRNREEVKRRGRSQTPDYGYGDHKRLFCICQEGCTARNSVEVTVRGYELSLRKQDAELIVVE